MLRGRCGLGTSSDATNLTRASGNGCGGRYRHIHHRKSYRIVSYHMLAPRDTITTRRKREHNSSGASAGHTNRRMPPLGSMAVLPSHKRTSASDTRNRSARIGPRRRHLIMWSWLAAQGSDEKCLKWGNPFPRGLGRSTKPAKRIGAPAGMRLCHPRPPSMGWNGAGALWGESAMSLPQSCPSKYMTPEASNDSPPAAWGCRASCALSPSKSASQSCAAALLHGTQKTARRSTSWPPPSRGAPTPSGTASSPVG